ncbi:MAG: hypothetical protein GY937_15240 [bacterium]|nr:hypothetical protein [bacterium]
MGHPERGLSVWAQARRAELDRLASVLQEVDSLEAYRFWTHARCLDPSDPDLFRRAAEAASGVIHRASTELESSPFDTQTTGAETLEGAIRLAMRPLGSSREPNPVAPRPSSTRDALRVAILPREAPSAEIPAASSTSADALDVVLMNVERMIDEARFRSALEALPEVREAADALPDEAGRKERVARAELLAGTAQIALGQPDQARKHFRRAIQASPGLELRASTPPKVRRAFEAVRSGT